MAPSDQEPSISEPGPAARVGVLAERLRSRGYRLTHQRLAVLDTLLSRSDHPSAGELATHVRARYPMISLATVYQTLDLLKELGEVLELDFGEGFNRYDARHPYPHAHAICEACGVVGDVLATPPVDLTAWATVTTGFAVHGYRLNLFGRCPSCRQAGAGAEGAVS